MLGVPVAHTLLFILFFMCFRSETPFSSTSMSRPEAIHLSDVIVIRVYLD